MAFETWPMIIWGSSPHRVVAGLAALSRSYKASSQNPRMAIAPSTKACSSALSWRCRG